MTIHGIEPEHTPILVQILPTLVIVVILISVILIAFLLKKRLKKL